MKFIRSKPPLPRGYMRPMGAGGNRGACLMRRSAANEGQSMPVFAVLLYLYSLSAEFAGGDGK